MVATTHRRLHWLASGKLQPLVSPESQAAADWSYLETARKLADGLAQALAAYPKSADPEKQLVAQLWERSAAR